MTLTVDQVRAAARRADAAAIHGRKTIATVQGPTVAYDVERLVARGSVTNVYLARAGRNEAVLLKVARDPRFNAYLQREADVLTELGELPVIAQPYLPLIVESFDCDDAVTNTRRRITAINYVEGLHTLAAVHERYPGGVDARDMAWMLRRLLVALGFVHAKGFVHCAPLPCHVLIHPEQHGVMLAGFTTAVHAGAPFTAVVDQYRGLYPTGIPKATPAVDLALAVNTMRAITREEPQKLTRFFDGCRLGLVPNDAFDLLQEFDALIEQLWGPRTFRPFAMT